MLRAFGWAFRLRKFVVLSLFDTITKCCIFNCKPKNSMDAQLSLLRHLSSHLFQMKKNNVKAVTIMCSEYYVSYLKCF